MYETTTVKIGGSASPSTKRQNTSACRLGASAIMISGAVASTIAAAITRLRPSTSAIAPAKGAESAMASVVAVTVRLICAGVASNSRASEGSSECGPYRLKNAQNPGMPTAARRKLWFMCGRGSSAHGLSGNAQEIASARKRSPGMPQRLLGRAGRVDLRPGQQPEIVSLLMSGDVCICVRCIAGAPAQTGCARLEISGEEQAAERYAARTRNLLERGTLALSREHRIDDGRVACRNDPLRPGVEQIIDLCVCFGG